MNESKFEHVFGNSRKVTHVIQDQGEWLWVRRFSEVHHEEKHAISSVNLANIDNKNVQFLHGAQVDGLSVYRMGAPASVFIYFHQPQAWSFDKLQSVVFNLGIALGELHSNLALLDVELSKSKRIDIIDLLLDREATHMALAKANIIQTVQNHFDQEVLSKIVTWFKRSDGMLAHGEFSSSNITSPDPTTNKLRVALDPCFPVLPPGFDIGWFLGDLYEASMAASGAFGPRGAVELATQFISGYQRVCSKMNFTTTDIRYSFLLRLLHHYVEFRLQNPTLGEELYFLDAVKKECEGQSGSYIYEIFGGLD